MFMLGVAAAWAVEVEMATIRAAGLAVLRALAVAGGVPHARYAGGEGGEKTIVEGRGGHGGVGRGQRRRGSRDAVRCGQCGAELFGFQERRHGCHEGVGGRGGGGGVDGTGADRLWQGVHAGAQAYQELSVIHAAGAGGEGVKVLCVLFPVGYGWLTDAAALTELELIEQRQLEGGAGRRTAASLEMLECVQAVVAADSDDRPACGFGEAHADVRCEHLVP